MKFSTAIAILVTVTTVSASVPDTNAARFARGLPPKAPVQRWTPSLRDKRSTPSGTPSNGQCSTGSAQCCDAVTDSTDPEAVLIAELLGIVIPTNANVGLTCSPISDGGSSCTQQSVCCDNNSYNGIIAIGCTPISP